MVTIEIVDDSLIVHVKGLDKLWAAKSTLEIPLAHVARVELGVAAEAQTALHDSWRVGTHWPHLITAGRYYRDGKIAFWDVHSGDQAISIYVLHDDYTHLIVEVDDPLATVDAIRKQLTARR